MALDPQIPPEIAWNPPGMVRFGGYLYETSIPPVSKSRGAVEGPASKCDPGFSFVEIHADVHL